MSAFLYVDNSNVWIEGMHVAAVAAGEAPNIWFAQQYGVTVPYRLDFGRLYNFAAGETKDVRRAVLYGSRPPPNDSLWRAAESRGFEVVVYDRSIANKEKKVDTKIATDITADSYASIQLGEDEMVLVAGDRDYVPVAESVTERGIPFHVVFWSHAANELKEVATSFTDLDPFLDLLRQK